MRSSKRTLRGQSLVEMAMVAPFLVMTLLMVIDCGRAAYAYSALAGAARAAARSAITTGSSLPTNNRVLTTAKQNAFGLAITAASCPNDPVPSNPTMSANTGLVYVGAPAGSPATAPNAPAGQAAASAGSCVDAVIPSYASHNPLTVTIKYNFEPLTPLGSQFFPHGIVMTVTSTMNTEY
jgi:Flp pilus assembly protein TadG